MLCLFLLIQSASGYQSIPIIGYYFEKAEDVNVHLDDDKDLSLTPSAPDIISYTESFSMYGELKRQAIIMENSVLSCRPFVFTLPRCPSKPLPHPQESPHHPASI